MTGPEETQAGIAARAERADAGKAARTADAARAEARTATVSPWRGTAPELAIAAVLVAAAAVVGYAMAGWAGLSVVAIAATAVAMVMLRALLPQRQPDAAKKAIQKPQARTLSGYSRRRFVVHNAMTSGVFYDRELRPVLEHLLAARPGLGKTLIARSFAKVLGLDFARIQFTPDLLPSDVVGAPLYDQRSAEMVFRPGPVFTQLLLADEINRTPPKTQAALLEAMGEGQVSVDGQTRGLPRPFVVLATDNPIEYEGTYELPEAQLDRFLMRLRLGYLTAGDETAVLSRRVARTSSQLPAPAEGSALLRLVAAGALIAAGLVLPHVASPGGRDEG